MDFDLIDGYPILLTRTRLLQREGEPPSGGSISRSRTWRLCSRFWATITSPTVITQMFVHEIQNMPQKNGKES